MPWKVYYGSSKVLVYSQDKLYQVNHKKTRTEDIITFTVDTDEQIIYARITKPSQHTRYLISQGRCRMTINCHNFKGHGPLGQHMSGFDPEGHQIAHSSGLGRGSYRFHKHWSLCVDWGRSSLLNANGPIRVNDVDDVIEIPYHYHVWRSGDNVKGYAALAGYSHDYGHPSRAQWYFTIRIALLSAPSEYEWINSSVRPYAISDQTATLTFENEN